MIVIKLIGCSMIVLCSCVIGNMVCAEMRLRIKEIEAIIYMGEYMSNHIKYGNVVLKELFDEMCNINKLRNIRFIHLCSQYLDEGYNFPDAFEKSIIDSKKDMHLHIDDINIIMGLKTDLGATYTEGQIKTLSLFCVQMEELLESAKETYSNNGSLYQKLSVLVGIGISILLF